jgi:hypothetical protein
VNLMKLRQFRKIAIDRNPSWLAVALALVIVLVLTLVASPAAQAQTFSVIHTFTGSGGGNTWVYTSLHDFTGVADGAYPISNVTIDTDGTLYGTTSQGGSSGDGVVWMIKP